MIHISTGKLTKKNCFGPIRSFFFNGSNWENFVEKLVKQTGEDIWWIRYGSQHAHTFPRHGVALNEKKKAMNLCNKQFTTHIFFDKVPVLVSDSVKNDWSWLPFNSLLMTTQQPILNSENMYCLKKNLLYKHYRVIFAYFFLFSIQNICEKIRCLISQNWLLSWCGEQEIRKKRVYIIYFHSCIILWLKRYQFSWKFPGPTLECLSRVLGKVV